MNPTNVKWSSVGKGAVSQTHVLHARVRRALGEVLGGAQTARQRRVGRQLALHLRRERQLASRRSRTCNTHSSLPACLPVIQSTEPILLTFLEEHFQLVLQRLRIPVPGSHCVSAIKCRSPNPLKLLKIYRRNYLGMKI